ncbi:MAG TPA: NAD(P)/FAD-dependent oxidoreductase [Candidatus Limnocylindrales bacterium]|nr:NAD(P)/FAD-dependent oxidoreductase [Candidatus Limnocylindrales bacterium]
MPAFAESSSDAVTQPRVRVAILGAGMSGICMAIELRRKGIDDFIILEKAASVGGTWRENTYPGVACDVPSHVYSFSFELNPDWTHSYSSGREIWEYCERTVDKYDLRSKIRFGCKVTDLVRDERHWTIHTEGGETWRSDAVVSALGGLHLPNRANLEGIETFAGARFHTAEWDHSVALKGRRVAIIGTGASTAQVLPGIAGEVAEVTVFQRSAAWVFPRLASDIAPQRRAMFRRFPWLMRLYRWYLWAFMDFVGTLSLRRKTWFASRLRRQGLQHLENSVQDPALRARLTPDYEPGCKRRCISDDYLTTYNRSNVHLVTDPIARVEPGGIRDATGKLHEVDIIVEATGFRPFDISDYVNIVGKAGRRLRDVWSDKIETLRTMMVPGFPNFFLLLGPNSATGHTSALIMIESQARYAASSLEWMEREGVAEIDPDPLVVARYNERLQRDMQRMVFSGGCNAWYTDRNDRNYTLWPYSALRFLAEQRRPRRREFLVRSAGSTR